MRRMRRAPAQGRCVQVKHRKGAAEKTKIKRTTRSKGLDLGCTLEPTNPGVGLLKIQIQ